MAKFVYRMQSVLDIKYKLEEQAKQHYMTVQTRLNSALDELEALRVRKEEYFHSYRELLAKQLNVLEIETCKNAILIMDEYIEEQQNKVNQIEQELEQAADAMKAAMKERKIYEKLKERQFEVFLQELNKEEMKEIDQLVSYQYNVRNTEED
ncbi:MAG: flagellar export protein FliJ [Clostridiales bacterium]|nr:flagellar export protein FliJ [Clostridiales bacterium]